MRLTKVLYTAATLLLIAAPVLAASKGDRCKVPTADPQYTCPLNSVCLQAIGNKYCSSVGKVCGWPDKSGYNLGKQKYYKEKWYECFPNGFQRVKLNGADCTLSSQCKNHNCGGPVGEMTCGGAVPVAATPQQMIEGMQASGLPLISIVTTVENAFGLGGAEMAANLKLAEFSGPDTAGALKFVYDPGLDDLGSWMLEAEWSPEVVASILKSHFGATADRIASFLKSTGHSAGATMAVIQAVFDVSVSVAAAAAKAANFALEPILNVMVATMGTTQEVVQFALDHTLNSKQALTATATTLELLGAAVNTVRDAAIQTGKWSAALIESVLAGVYNLVTSAPSDATAPASQSMFPSSGAAVGFPDVCKTPSPAGPVPIPYPNLGFLGLPNKTGEAQKNAVLKHSEFRVGSYRLLSGETLVIRPSAAGRPGSGPPTAKASVADTRGRERAIRSSTLLELPNGGFCAVCMARGEVTSIRLLMSAREEKSNRTRKR